MFLKSFNFFFNVTCANLKASGSFGLLIGFVESITKVLLVIIAASNRTELESWRRSENDDLEVLLPLLLDTQPDYHRSTSL